MSISPSALQPSSPSSLWGRIACAHVAVLGLFLGWAFGGQSGLARQILALALLPGPVLLIAALIRHAPVRREALLLLGPLALFALLQGTACLQPLTRVIPLASGPVVALVNASPHLPGSAAPALTARELWQFCGTVIAAANLLLLVRGRRPIRVLIAVLAINAALLAVFGTVERLGGHGYWFGAVQPPENALTFSTFVYRNHWAAFALASLAVTAVPLIRGLLNPPPRGFSHSPAFLAPVGILLLLATLPLSTSRSGTLLGLAWLLGLGLLLLRERSRSRGAPAIRRRWLVPALLGTVLATGWLAAPELRTRWRDSAEQWTDIRARGDAGSRKALYADTLRMWQQRPLFGWGLESYATVFPAFNRQISAEGWRPRFEEAHSDWLQSLAENGAVGTALLVLLGLIPLLRHRRALFADPAALALLSGPLLIALYAALEFPLANPAAMLLFWTSLYGGCALVKNRPPGPSIPCSPS